MDELWKDIKGYEGLYQASNFGNIRLLNNNKHLKQGILSKGYLRVTLSKKSFLSHRIIATTFIPNPDNKKCVNHIDGNKLNNNVNNLEWCTHSENMQHAWDNGLHSKNHLFKSVYCIDTKETFDSAIFAARKYNTYSTHITACCKGRRETAGKKHWRYI